MTPRFIPWTAAALCALTLTACASGPSSGNTYETEFAKLTSECEGRGGILATNGQQTGDPARDYVCEIRGQPSSRIR
jgi:outer membrane lipoprotein SlyB